MSIITLTTDFGIKDHFVGALKGKIILLTSPIILIYLMFRKPVM